MRPAYLEATDPDAPARRAAAGRTAGREVLGSALTNERDGVDALLRRLAQLKRELQGVLASATSTPFRRFTATSLITDVDRLIADATADVVNGTRSVLSTAAGLGSRAVDDPINAARIALSAGPQLDAKLVSHAFAQTADLLTEPMQQFRNQVVRSIRRSTLVGDSQSTHLQQLSANIADAGFDSAAFKAERILRTETSRLLNEATFGRLVSLADQMPFLRKGWRAANDSRTRTGHREASQVYARGSGIPIAQPFKINVYQEARITGGGLKVAARLLGAVMMRFPVDPLTTPEGRLAAASTIMCRCNAFTDFDLADLRAWSTSRSRMVSPGAPAPTIQRGFAEPPIDRPEPGPRPATIARPTPVPAPALPVARVEPTPSIIPGGEEFLAPYDRAVRPALEDAYRDLMAASKFDQDQGHWREALQTIAADGTRGTVEIGGASYVMIPDALAAEISQSAVWIHTHPSGTAFSFADLRVLAKANDGVMRMVVYGNYGTWHELRAPLTALPRTADMTTRMHALERSYNEQYFAAAMKAKARTDAAALELAREAGISLGQLMLSPDGQAELQALYFLHMQEETADAWSRFAAQWGMSYRFYLPPANTRNATNRSR